MANDGQAEEGSVSGGGRQPAAGGGCPTALPASDPPLSRRSVAAVFAGLLVAMTVGTLNQTIVATVLPTIVGELGGVNRMLWVTTSYVLAATVTMPLYGKMGDLIGRKGLFIGALALFVAGSAACALAPSMEGLVIGRAVQGLGGGGLMVLSQAIVADVVPPRRRALYLSIMGVAYAVPMLAGPLLGGFFADAVGWRWAFWFDVPLALAAIVIAAVFLPKPRRTAERAPFDVGGAVTLVAAVTALTLATLWGGNEHAWTSPTIIGLLVATAVASALFVLAERRAREPLMALSLFKNRNFDISIVASSITMFVMIGVLTYLPTYFQIVDDLNATAAGYLVAPMNAAWFAASLLSGYLVNKLGTYKKLMVVSFAVLVAGMVGFIAVDQDPSAVVVGGLLAVMGFGVGLNFEILVLVVQNEFPASAVGMATAASGRSARTRTRSRRPSCTRCPRTCAMRWAPPTATRSRPCSGSRCRWPWRASCSCCSCARRGWPPPWTDRGMGPTKARTTPGGGRARDAASPRGRRGRQPTLTGQGCGCSCGLGGGYTTFMSELFFDTIDESEIPAGMARVRYEAGAVEPLYANDEFFSLLGYQRRSPDDFYPLDVRNSHGWRAFCGQLRAHIEAGETDFEIEVNQETATGTLLWTMARCRHDARRGTVTCLVLDVSSWMDTSERLRMSEDAFRIAAQMSGKNIATFDLADRALTMQGAVEGYLTAPARMVNVPDSAIAAGMIAPEHVELYRSLYRDMETGVPRGGVMLRMRDFDTRRFRWYQVDYSLVFDGENRPVYAVVAFGDTTERHERELVQKARAERDALTGVLNRATFEDGCTRIIERSEVDHGHALIMADLDRFKTTNDRYGHVAGDCVIVESVAGVVSAVRDDDLVGRVGGDEFMVCLRGISSHLMVEAVAQRMCAAVREAAEASDDDHGPVSISLGIALYPQDGVTYEELYRKADKALYCAKRAGGGTYAFYRDEPAAS